MSVQMIFKYPFQTKDSVSIDVPGDAEILTVQLQNGMPCMWAKVNPEQPNVTRNFVIYGTGEPTYEMIVKVIQSDEVLLRQMVMWHPSDTEVRDNLYTNIREGKYKEILRWIK